MSLSCDEFNLKSIISELNEGSYRIGVFGEFSTGKSTFLNALMGEDILSVATEPTTATPTGIQWARAFNVIVFGKSTNLCADHPVIASFFPVGGEPIWARLMKDGVLGTLQHETASIRRFLERWTKEGLDADKTHEVLIQLPQPFLKSRIALIDTPGVNNEFTKHQGITKRVIDDVDLALCLLDARQGGKASDMHFIQSVVGKAALTRVVVNKMDLIDEDEREDLIEAIYSTMLNFWPKDRGPCPRPWPASSLASLDLGCQAKFPELAKGFDDLREELKEQGNVQRPNRILARCGDWDKKQLERALNASKDGRHAESHECLLDVLTLYQEASLNIPDLLLERIRDCEEAMKGATSHINEAHALVDRAAVILLRNDPNNEVRACLRQAGEIFKNAQVSDLAFVKLAKQTWGVDAYQYIYNSIDSEKILNEAIACLAGEFSESEKLCAFKSLLPLANQGYTLAKYWVAMAVLAGEECVGDAMDKKQAMVWLREAAEEGNHDAECALGDCYLEGIGVEMDEKQGVGWLQKAANHGNIDAKNELDRRSGSFKPVLLGLDIGASKVTAVVAVMEKGGALNVTGASLANPEGGILGARSPIST